jgi:16S rRNA pseudouridine516 synthase
MKRAQRLDKLISSLGYCTRGEVQDLIADGRIEANGWERLKVSDHVDPTFITIDGEPLDPGPGMVVLLNKPLGLTCSRADVGDLVYSLFPERWTRRKPLLASVGRLDKETSGTLLFTDDGELLHRLTSPKNGVKRRYQVTLESPLAKEAQTVIRAGGLLLPDDPKPLLPAELVATEDPLVWQITLTEGRYHHVRRTFELMKSSVLALHRSEYAGLSADTLEPGEFRIIKDQELSTLRSL